MFVRYGLGDELQDRITQYQRALPDLTTAIGMAERGGQPSAADQLRVQFVALTAVVNDLIRQKRERENPSAFGIKLASDERLLQTQRDVKQAARDIVIARTKKDAVALKAAKAAFQQAAVVQTQAVKQARQRETPSAFSLGLADLGLSFGKYLPLLALGLGAALIVPPLLARRR